MKETDTLTHRALNQLRDCLDEPAPSIPFVATTRALKDLHEELQSHFQVSKFDPVQTPVIPDLLIRRHPQCPEPSLRGIAAKSSGTVRAALEDGASEMDVCRFRETAARPRQRAGTERVSQPALLAFPDRPYSELLQDCIYRLQAFLDPSPIDLRAAGMHRIVPAKHL